MSVELTKKYFFPSDASPKDVRVSGAIFLIVAIAIGGVMFAVLMNIGQMNFMPILLWVPFVLWLVGMHRILWGGTTAVNRWLSMGRVAVTAVAGFISLWIVSGLTGVIVAIVKKVAA